MQRDVIGSRRVEHGRQTPGCGLVGTPRRLTPNGLPVYYLYLAAELFGQLSPDLDGDQLRLEVLRSRPVTDGAHSPPPLVACLRGSAWHVHGSGGLPWWTIQNKGGPCLLYTSPSPRD